MFPGSFDPFTAGHLNILKRALTMFDEVVVAVGINIDKRGFFTNEKRIEIIRQAVAGLEGVSIIQYDNLTIDKCRELGIRHIVRGVRNMIDFETERSIADANKSFEHSCNCCCHKGMHLDCDRCAISAVHNMVVACFEHLNGKENKVSA